MANAKTEPPKPPQSLVTARLRLRRPRLDDAEPLFEAYTQDPDVTRYLSWAPHSSIDETLQFLDNALGLWERTGLGPYIIEPKEYPALRIGSIGVAMTSNQTHHLSLGYVLAKPFWGRGLMTEAAHCLTEWALAQKGIWRVSAFCDLENIASARVLEKAGLTYEGTIRRYIIAPNVSPEPRHVRMYAKVRDAALV